MAHEERPDRVRDPEIYALSRQIHLLSGKIYGLLEEIDKTVVLIEEAIEVDKVLDDGDTLEIRQAQ